MPRSAITSCATLLLACILSAASSAALHAADDAPPPNIIFILADDLGYGDLGCYGQQRIRTPRLDQMAAEGMRFTNFYAGSTVCAPSRCVLMTGLHTGHCYIRGNAKMNLRPDDVTVPEVLASAGYASGLVGKWGLGHEGSSGVPTRQGFESFFGYLDQTHAHNYYPTFLMRNDERVPLRNVVPDERETGAGVATTKLDYSHDLLAERALAFVDEHRDERFFLYLALTIPHANNEAKSEGMEVPDYGVYADLDWPEPQKGHAAMITRMDRDIGRLLDRLKQHGLDERTLVMFSSDNGPHAEGGNDPEFNNSNGPLRGKKRDMTDGGIRVPLIARWPGHVQAGAVSDHVGYFGDLMATCAELAGAEPPSGIDSLSFAPELLGNKQPRHDYLYWEFYEQGSAQAVRQGRWKAIRAPMFSGPIALYNVAEDLGEEHNVAAEHPELVERMRQIMDEAHVASPDWKIRGASGKKRQDERQR